MLALLGNRNEVGLAVMPHALHARCMPCIMPSMDPRAFALGLKVW